MQPRTFRQKLRKHMDNDAGISPVIGTILMIAATVIIGGAVYAAVNAYSGRASSSNVDAVFRAQALDTDSNGALDTLKITYLSGPDGANVVLDTKDSASAAVGTMSGAWSADPGDFKVYNPTLAPVSPYFVTASIGDQTYLDQTLRLEE